jgi:hypothetical protein
MYPVGMMRSTSVTLLCGLAMLSFSAVARAQSPMTSTPMHEDAKTVQPSHSLNVTYAGHTVTMSVEDLLKLPQQTITAHDGHTNKDVTFSGPLVADVLAKAGLVGSDETHKLILHSTVIATGTDGYYVLYSCAEIEPRFTSAKVIVAVMQEGLPVPSGIQIVDPLDVKPARWVHGLSGLNVMTLNRTQ